VAAVITSPPYGGTYDYVEHQARRYPWFGIASEPLRRREIGSRSRFTAANPKKIDDWDREVDQVLRAIARVLRRDAPCVLLVGDGQLGGRRIEADRQMKRIAAGCGLRWVATASQPRPDWMGGQDRSEHLIWLTRSESGGDASAS
jgi:hypothetical protein